MTAVRSSPAPNEQPAWAQGVLHSERDPLAQRQVAKSHDSEPETNDGDGDCGSDFDVEVAGQKFV